MFGFFPSRSISDPVLGSAASAYCQSCGASQLKSQNLSGTAKAISNAVTRSAPSKPAKNEPLFIPPVDPSYGYVTSPSHQMRKDPVTGNFTRIHTGLDIASVIDNTPIRAARSGVIIRATMNCSNTPKKNSAQRNCGGRWGNQIQIRHDDGSISIYGHLDSRCKIKVQEGALVKQGEDIGCMGRSGWATGVHLCFNIRKSATGPYIHSGRAMGHHYQAYLKKWEKKFNSKLAALGESNGVSN